MNAEDRSYASRGLIGFLFISGMFLPLAAVAVLLAGVQPMLFVLLSGYAWVTAYLELGMIAGRLPYGRRTNDPDAPLAGRKWFWVVSDVICTSIALAFLVFVGMSGAAS